MHHVLIVAAEDIYMRWHMNKVACIGDQSAQDIARFEGFLGGWGHLHQVDIEVQKTGVIPGTGEVGEGGLERGPGFGGRGPFGFSPDELEAAIQKEVGPQKKSSPPLDS